MSLDAERYNCNGDSRCRRVQLKPRLTPPTLTPSTRFPEFLLYLEQTTIKTPASSGPLIQSRIRPILLIRSFDGLSPKKLITAGLWCSSMRMLQFKSSSRVLCVYSTKTMQLGTLKQKTGAESCHLCMQSDWWFSQQQCSTGQCWPHIPVSVKWHGNSKFVHSAWFWPSSLQRQWFH